MRTIKNTWLGLVQSVVVAGLLVACVGGAYAGTYYWDENSDTAGFGTASGTWGTDTKWSTDATGASVPGTTATTTSDDVNFGTASAGLGAGSVTVSGSSQGFQTLTFGGASGAIVLTNGTLQVGAVSTVQVSNTVDTIASDLTGDGQLVVRGAESAKLILMGNNTYTGGTVVASGQVEVTQRNSALPTASGDIVVNENGELILNVSGIGQTDTPVGGKNNPITVNGGRLTVMQPHNIGYWLRPVTINGGIFNDLAGGYMGTVVLQNGALYSGKLDVGYRANCTLSVSGTQSSTLSATVKLVGISASDTLFVDVADVTGDDGVDLLFSGTFNNYNADITKNGRVVKNGEGRMSLTAVSPWYSHRGLTINAGVVSLDCANALDSRNIVTLSGGTLGMGDYANSFSNLTVNGYSSIELGTGPLSFSDSSAASWLGRLNLNGTFVEQSIRFGTNSLALTQAQLDAIDYNDVAAQAELDAEGYLVLVPYPKLVSITNVTTLVNTNTSTSGGMAGWVKKQAGYEAFPGPLVVKNYQTDGTYSFKGYFRFDISGVEDIAYVTNVTLRLTVDSAVCNLSGGEASVTVWGLTDETLDEWDADTTTWGNAPASVVSGGVMDATKAIRMEGTNWTFTTANVSGDPIVYYSGTNLLNFIEADSNGLVTLMLVKPDVSTSETMQFYGNDSADENLVPRLTFNMLLPAAGTVIAIR